MNRAAPPYLWALESSWLMVLHSSKLIFFFRLHYFGVISSWRGISVYAFVESWSSFNKSMNGYTALTYEIWEFGCWFYSFSEESETSVSVTDLSAVSIYIVFTAWSVIAEILDCDIKSSSRWTGSSPCFKKLSWSRLSDRCAILKWNFMRLAGRATRPQTLQHFWVCGLLWREIWMSEAMNMHDTVHMDPDQLTL